MIDTSWARITSEGNLLVCTRQSVTFVVTSLLLCSSGGFHPHDRCGGCSGVSWIRFRQHCRSWSLVALHKITCTHCPKVVAQIVTRCEQLFQITGERLPHTKPRNNETRCWWRQSVLNTILQENGSFGVWNALFTVCHCLLTPIRLTDVFMSLGDKNSSTTFFRLQFLKASKVRQQFGWADLKTICFLGIIGNPVLSCPSVSVFKNHFGCCPTFCSSDVTDHSDLHFCICFERCTYCFACPFFPSGQYFFTAIVFHCAQQGWGAPPFNFQSVCTDLWLLFWTRKTAVCLKLWRGTFSFNPNHFTLSARTNLRILTSRAHMKKVHTAFLSECCSAIHFVSRCHESVVNANNAGEMIHCADCIEYSSFGVL